MVGEGRLRGDDVGGVWRGKSLVPVTCLLLRTKATKQNQNLIPSAHREDDIDITKQILHELRELWMEGHEFSFIT